MLIVDTAPLGPEYRNRPGVGTLRELRSCCEQLIGSGVIDQAIEIDYSESYRKRVYKKHFASPVRHTHNHRGYPILGSIFAIEESQADYVVHFDSDMLLHQDRNFSWIERGITLLHQYPEVISVLPLSGAPTVDGTLKQQQEVGEAYERDPGGFYRFKTFTSRVFLINRTRFNSLLPLRLKLPWISIIKNYMTTTNTLPPWEDIIGGRLEETSFIRVDLDSPLAWTLHPEDHGPEFVKALPRIIERVEEGWFPSGQAGYYDLQLELWH